MLFEGEVTNVGYRDYKNRRARTLRSITTPRSSTGMVHAPPGVDTPRSKNILVHIYNDDAVKIQLVSNSPPEINQLFQQTRGKGFSDMDSLHAIAIALQEQNWNPSPPSEPFDLKTIRG